MAHLVGGGECDPGGVVELRGPDHLEREAWQPAAEDDQVIDQMITAVLNEVIRAITIDASL